MNSILERLHPIVDKLRQYTVLIVIIIFSAMYGYLLYTSGKLAQEEPSEVNISEKFQGAKRPKIDESVAQQLSGLEEQNIQIKGIFDQARNNPFSE
ncbi:MAG: hypothetical protein M3Q14_04680 [bacterium]|nr:hypothetical protein [bacterium]